VTRADGVVETWDMHDPAPTNTRDHWLRIGVAALVACGLSGACLALMLGAGTWVLDIVG
jgi:hypothetical protein